MSVVAALGHRTSSPAATEAAGRALGEVLRPGDLLALDGDLGAGKTVFVRGLVAGVGGDPEAVRSPTFVLHQVHSGGHLSLHHLDLFRLGRGADVRFLEIDLLLETGAVAVEWAELADLAGLGAVPLRFAVAGASERIITLGASAPARLRTAWPGAPFVPPS